jgi:hypothetical protein
MIENIFKIYIKDRMDIVKYSFVKSLFIFYIKKIKAFGFKKLFIKLMKYKIR